MSAGRRHALTRFSGALLGVACIVVALSFIDAAAHDMFAQSTARNPFDIGVREGSGPPPVTGFSGWVLSEQIRFERMLSGAVRAIKADASALWTLLGISFAYGVFHAAGPGHGKAVVASYMLANERSLRRGVIISLMAAILQGVVAVLIVGILAAVLNATSARMRDAAHAVEIASYAGIAVLGAWLIWRKGRGLLAVLGFSAPHHGHHHAPAADTHDHNHAAHRHQSPAHAHGELSHAHHDHHRNAHDESHDHGHTHAKAVAPAPHVHDEHCGHFHAPSPEMLTDKNFSWKTATLTVFAAGARPCSGAILVLVFALAQGIFFVGVAATFAMSIGTAITTGALAAMAVLAKGLAVRFLGEGSDRGVVAVRALELVAAILVFMLGASLLMGAFAGKLTVS
ncbi:MAG: nickel/cobalt transporter [Beijerinckiaceae bacterium]|nr:nickel/cobalt transporter [Beijerinckiaceae bacterium]